MATKSRVTCDICRSVIKSMDEDKFTQVYYTINRHNYTGVELAVMGINNPVVMCGQCKDKVYKMFRDIKNGKS